MTYAVGLTGGICSGKSTVARLFKELGANIISADAIAKQLLSPGEIPYNAVIDRFHEALLDNNQEINRKMLMEIILHNPKEKQWLEHLLHPMIRERIKQAINDSASPYTIIEIPLLYEARLQGQYEDLDRVIVIDCPAEIQMDRVIQRDKTTTERALAIIQQQASNKHRLSIADDTLSNSGSLAELALAIKQLDQQYTRLSFHGH